MKLSLIVGLALCAGALPALAENAPQPAYLDDRSTPESVIASYYNAINRAEYARAYSYFGAEDEPGFDKWKAGYADTAHVDIDFGQSAEEGAAGSTYYSLPVRLDVTSTANQHSYFAGCYTLRLAQPAIQEQPPFKPMHIVEGKLKEADSKALAPADCGD